MDIFEYAKEFNADYCDHSNGYIYKVQDYNKKKYEDVETDGIDVYDLDGNYVGIVKEKNT